MFITEAERRIPLEASLDVLVAGGGVSGCVAAAAAARTGTRTLFLERNGALGGVATAGLMLSARAMVQPRELEARVLQRGLLSGDAYLGDGERLQELALA